MLDPKQPYNTLPLLPPKVDLESKAILKKCISARTALAELRLAGGLIPDPSVLVHAIPNLEAKDSSAIENIVTTNDELYKDASGITQESSATTKEAARRSTRRQRVNSACATCSATGRISPIAARTSIRSCAWRCCTISLKRSTHSRTEMAGLGASSIS